MLLKKNLMILIKWSQYSILEKYELAILVTV